MLEFDWECVNEWEVDDEAMCFVFVYTRPDKKPRRVRIHTPYVSDSISSCVLIAILKLASLVFFPLCSTFSSTNVSNELRKKKVYTERRLYGLFKFFFVFTECVRCSVLEMQYFDYSL